MKILINVKEQTFQKTLIKMGYNYKIHQYDDFIKAMQRMVLKELTEAFNESKLTKIIYKIFNQDIPMSILENKEKIEFISKDFLKSLIDSGKLDIFLEEKVAKFRHDVQKNAYRLQVINKINFFNKSVKNNLIIENDYFSFYHRDGTRYITTLNCINSKGIDLTNEEKEIIENEINIKLAQVMLNKIDFDILGIADEITYFFPNKNTLHLDIQDYIRDTLLDIKFLDKNVNFGKVILNKTGVYVNRIFASLPSYKNGDILKDVKDFRKDKEKVKDRVEFNYFKKIKELSKLVKFEDDLLFSYSILSKTYDVSFQDLLDYKNK